jgi:hypothetical protein
VITCFFRCWSIPEISSNRVRDSGIGLREKEQCQAYLNSRLRDKRLESQVKSLFRPSYGGNRNYTLMYAVGTLESRKQSGTIFRAPGEQRHILA